MSLLDYLEKENVTSKENIAVIDTETNWNDSVMSIGLVIADSKTFNMIDTRYYILDPEYKVGGMFSSVMNLENDEDEIKCSRSEAISNILSIFKDFGVSKVFAYNAVFDRNHLLEMSRLEWYDIMRVAAYKQYNSKIPKNADCYKTGRLKRNYGVEAIFKMLTEDNSYNEVHNALYDALDELEIMKLLGLDLETYNCAFIGCK